jgi:hypothetical protein
MNADPQQRSIAQAKGETLIPSETAHPPPSRTHAPNKAARAVDIATLEIGHRCNPRGVLKTETTHCAFCIIS